MTTPELLAYIRDEMGKGVPRENIEKVLTDTGWSPADVAEAFNVISSPVPITPVPMMTPTPTLMSTQPTYSQPAYVAPVAHKSKLWLYVSILILLVIGGGAGYAYYAGYLPTSKLSITEVTDNVFNATSVTYDLDLTIIANHKEPQAETSSFLPGLDLNNIFFRSNGAVDMNSDDVQMYHNLSVIMGEVRVGGELRMLNKTLYALLKEVPSLGMGFEESVVNKWFSFDLDAPSESESSLDALGVSVPALPDLNAEQIAHLETLSKNASFIVVTGKNGSENFNDIDTNRYLFNLDIGKLEAYLITLLDFAKSLPDSNLADLDRESIKKELAKFNSFQGEVWIGKKDKFPYKVTIYTNEDMGEEGEDLGTVDTTLVLVLSGWNGPVTLEAPTSSQDFTEFLNASFGEARSKGADAAVKINVQSSRSWAEIHYDDNWSLGKEGYTGYCESEGYKGILDGIKNSSTHFELSCRDSKSNFVVYGYLSNDLIYCTDKMGIIELNEVPLGLSCN